MSSLPRIGLTLDAEEPGGYSKLPWYALRQNYAACLAEAGALPVALPHVPALAAHYAASLDGLVVTGGAFDIPPSLYGEQAVHPTVTLKPGRTDFEMALLKAMLAQKKPVLGICGGQQLLAVALGGTLIQHIPDAVPNALAHEQPNPRTQPGHSVAIVPGTLLHRIVGTTIMHVNSAHHQAVQGVPAPALVSASAPDGVIEAIEDPTHPFCLGVQWHPEYKVDEKDVSLFQALVAACG
jgi:putative glutamine amidotransferase